MRKAQTLKNYSDRRTLIPVPPVKPKSHSSKNTKRWCKGVAGREHDTEWADWSALRGLLNTPQQLAHEQKRQEERATGRNIQDYEIRVCKNCGRQFDWRIKNGT